MSLGRISIKFEGFSLIFRMFGTCVCPKFTIYVPDFGQKKKTSNNNSKKQENTTNIQATPPQTYNALF
jgi:hypothetical protein